MNSATLELFRCKENSEYVITNVIGQLNLIVNEQLRQELSTDENLTNGTTVTIICSAKLLIEKSKLFAKLYFAIKLE